MLFSKIPFNNCGPHNSTPLGGLFLQSSPTRKIKGPVGGKRGVTLTSMAWYPPRAPKKSGSSCPDKNIVVWYAKLPAAVQWSPGLVAPATVLEGVRALYWGREIYNQIEPTQIAGITNRTKVWLNLRCLRKSATVFVQACSIQRVQISPLAEFNEPHFPWVWILHKNKIWKHIICIYIIYDITKMNSTPAFIRHLLRKHGMGSPQEQPSFHIISTWQAPGSATKYLASLAPVVLASAIGCWTLASEVGWCLITWAFKEILRKGRAAQPVNSCLKWDPARWTPKIPL